MQSMLFDLDPPSLSGSLARLFLPNQHLSVIRTRSEDVPVFWVCPSDLPDWPSMPVFQVKDQVETFMSVTRTL